MALKGKPVAIATTDTTIYTCPSNTEASVHGLVFANTTASPVTITLKLYIQSLGTTTTIAVGLTVPANSTYTWPKPIDVNAGDYIQASASAGSAVVCLYSSYEGSAAPVAVGFTPRGAWSSGASYAVNDVVSYNNKSYLAIQASSNQQPDTATAYWLVLLGIDTSLVAMLSGAQTLTGPKRGAVTAANAGSFDMSLGNNFSATLAGAATLTFTNITAGQSGFILLVNGSAYTVSKASAVKCPSSLLAAISATGTYLLSYFSPDGTNVYLTASGALA